MIVAAVIVTRNRPESLSAALEAVLGQTRRPDLTLVVDNSDGPEVNAAVRFRFQSERGVRFAMTRRNLGGTGGFAAGIALGLADGADCVWLLDDDAYAQAGALAALLKTYRRFCETVDIGFVCSHVVWTDGSPCVMNIPKPAADWSRFYTPEQPVVAVQSCTFVSVLIPSHVIRAIGLPAPEFFIWYDDNEYTERITRRFVGLCEPASRVVHALARNEGAVFERVQEGNLWKFRYGVRNEIAVRRRHGGFGDALIASLRLLREFRSVPRLQHRILLLHALWQGWRFRYVPPAADAGSLADLLEEAFGPLQQVQDVSLETEAG